MGNVSITCGERNPGVSRSDEVWNALDEDNSGVISRQEIIEWVKDERFIRNPHFSDDTLKKVAKRVEAMIDEDGDRKISKEELDKYLNSLDEETYNALTNSLRNFRDDARTEAIQRVFESLDVDGDGEVSKPEVLFWLQNEESWVRYFAAEGGGNEEKKREEVYNRIDKDANGNITLSEMSDFFKDWTLRDLRSFSQDQMYYKALREYSRNPSEEGKKKLKEMKNDRMWGDRETRRERRASKREKIDLDA